MFFHNILYSFSISSPLLPPSTLFSFFPHPPTFFSEPPSVQLNPFWWCIPWQPNGIQNRGRRTFPQLTFFSLLTYHNFPFPHPLASSSSPSTPPTSVLCSLFVMVIFPWCISLWQPGGISGSITYFITLLRKGPLIYPSAEHSHIIWETGFLFTSGLNVILFSWHTYTFSCMFLISDAEFEVRNTRGCTGGVPLVTPSPPFPLFLIKFVSL